MTYEELKQRIIDFAESDEPVFVGNIDGFIKTAEQGIYNSVQLRALRKNVMGSVEQESPYLSLPNDFLSVFSLAVVDENGSEYLLVKDVSFIREAYPSATDAGKPRYYAIFGPASSNSTDPRPINELSIIIGPTPDKKYAVELHYFYYPESIVTAGETWLGDNFDMALFYGSMRQAALFQRMTKDVVENYEQKYAESMALLQMLGDGKQQMDYYRNSPTKRSGV